MTALPLVITTAGLARFTDAQVDDDIDLGITSVGLTDQVFVVAPTLTALPGQFREVETISGEAVGDNIVHMIVRDEAELEYTVRGFGLFLADGTLFAVYGQADPIFEKAAVAAMLLAVDIAFPAGNVELITFGDTNFLNPPATTTQRGVVELATPAEAIAGESGTLAITPAALAAAIAAAIEANDPIGTGKLWWGVEADVAPGWAVCKGQTVARSDGNGDITLPDMRDRTVVGAGGEHLLGATFGAWSQTVDTETAGAHDHGVELPDHTHAAGDLTATVETGETGASLTWHVKGDTASGGTGKTIAVPPDPNAPTPPAIVDPGHDHGATIAGSTGEGGAAELTTSEAVAHKHGLTIDTAQPSLAWHFIMRI